MELSKVLKYREAITEAIAL
uniref:Uncharacterized protein n=1 Tax=Anguilla anguilla TaxID=7936 RepID=A0A0E9SP30_ANGAN